MTKEQLYQMIEDFKRAVGRFFQENSTIFSGLIAISEGHPLPPEAEKKE